EGAMAAIILTFAEQRAGRITELQITSTVGGRLRLLSPWPTIAVGGRTLQPDACGIVEVATRPGERFTFAEK
ncbi:MAG: hypothetical protein JJ992_17030, partial [Planctomycetes bacterium]|nr:hypothetical protein [Planctomycetota bacterium]